MVCPSDWARDARPTSCHRSPCCQNHKPACLPSTVTRCSRLRTHPAQWRYNVHSKARELCNLCKTGRFPYPCPHQGCVSNTLCCFFPQKENGGRNAGELWLQSIALRSVINPLLERERRDLGNTEEPWIQLPTGWALGVNPTALEPRSCDELLAHPPRYSWGWIVTPQRFSSNFSFLICFWMWKLFTNQEDRLSLRYHSVIPS